MFYKVIIGEKIYWTNQMMCIIILLIF